MVRTRLLSVGSEEFKSLPGLRTLGFSVIFLGTVWSVSRRSWADLQNQDPDLVLKSSRIHWLSVDPVEGTSNRIQLKSLWLGRRLNFAFSKLNVLFYMSSEKVILGFLALFRDMINLTVRSLRRALIW